MSMSDSDTPKASPFESAHEVRHIHLYCSGLCQHRCRLPQSKNLKMAARVMPCQCLILTTQLNLKTWIESTVNPMRQQLPSHMDALFAKPNSIVGKSETDTSKRTFHIRFFVHPRVVSGRVVVNGISQNTRGRNTRTLVKLLWRRQSGYTTRGSLWT
jgi:hypothetical protein